MVVALPGYLYVSPHLQLNHAPPPATGEGDGATDDDAPAGDVGRGVLPAPHRALPVLRDRLTIREILHGRNELPPSGGKPMRLGKVGPEIRRLWYMDG